jgi:hypothetical protein
MQSDEDAHDTPAISGASIRKGLMNAHAATGASKMKTINGRISMVDTGGKTKKRLYAADIFTVWPLQIKQPTSMVS